MGVVYLAEHPRMGPAALKFVHAASADDETFRARFRREVEAADRVRSPRVAPVLAADPDAAVPWLATSFVDGPTLGEAVADDAPLHGERLISLAVALADALGAIHGAGVVHRDLKPSNILLTPETPVVIDFGIASFREAPTLTRTGATLGSPGWMAPEQVTGHRSGRRVDVFAWGLVVAFAASGRMPFGQGPAHALYYRVVHEAPDVPALPAPLDRLVRSALAKDPRHRPDVRHLLDALTAGMVGAAAGTAGDTIADRTEVVPTIVARGWGADVLPPAPTGGAVVPSPSPSPGSLARPGAAAPGARRLPPPPPPDAPAPAPVTAATAGSPSAAPGSAAPGSAAPASAAPAPVTATTAAPASAHGGPPLNGTAATRAASATAGGAALAPGAADATAATRAAGLAGAPAAAGGRDDTGPTEVIRVADGPGGAGPPAGARSVGTAGPGAGNGNGAGPDATLASRAAGPSFWFAGAEHHDARSLAAALQRDWDTAVDQLFTRRDPIWLGELQAFLRARHLVEADRIVTAGVDPAAPGAPVAATMARLLLGLDPVLEPRVGPILLTPEGLEAAAQAVEAGRDPGDRLSQIREAHVLRLWRSLPGMERAAGIDERWQAGLDAFGRLVATVSPHVGWPAAAERQRAAAVLLLSAVSPEHEKRLARRLSAARLTAARHQAWWAELAAEGRHSPAAGALAVMTAERARELAKSERDATREADRRRRDAERQAREAERQRREAVQAARQPVWRYRPLPQAQSAVRRAWVLVASVAALVLHLWALSALGDALLAHYEAVDGPGAAASLRAYDGVERNTALVALLVVVLPAAHVATRVVLRKGAPRPVVRAYAGACAVIDLLLAFAFLTASTLAGLVVDVGAESQVGAGSPQPFGTEPWALVLLQVPFGLVGVVLVVRSIWRIARAVFGGLVTGPPLPAPPRVR